MVNGNFYVLALVPCIAATWSPNITVLDLALTDNALRGFEGGFADGQRNYGYFVPHYNGDHSGHFARVSLRDFSTVEVLDLSKKDASLKGFKRGFANGDYGYLVPHYTDGAPSGKVARVDLNRFSVEGVEILNLTETLEDLHGFEGGLSDRLYGYLVPHFNGKIPRFDLQGFSTVDVLDLTLVDRDLRGFDGGFIAANHIYLCPRYNYEAFGKVVRFDSHYFAAEHVHVLDLNKTDSDLRGFSDCFSDGTFGYFVPRWNGAAFGKIARVDLYSFANVNVLDLASTDHDLKGFGGGFCDEDFAYFVPRWKDEGGAFGKFVRVFLRDFRSSHPRIDVVDLTAFDPDLKGFSGAFFDESFAYLVPFDNGAQFGKVVRIALTSGSNNMLGMIIVGFIALVVIAAGAKRRLATMQHVAACKRDQLASESGVELISTHANRQAANS